MDKFVQDQLRLCHCEQLIDVFKEKGIHEHKYKSLRLSQLLDLIPDDDDAVHSVFTNIRSHSIKIKKLWAINADPTDFDGSVVPKVEPEDNEEEIQIVCEVINTSGNVRPVKTEGQAPATPPPTPDPDPNHDQDVSQELGTENDDQQQGSPGAMRSSEGIVDEEITNANQNTGNSVVDNELGDQEFLPVLVEPNISQPNDPEMEIENHEINLNRRVLRKRPGSSSNQLPSPPQKRMTKSDAQSPQTQARRAFLRATFSASDLDAELKYDREDRVWKICLTFSELRELEEFFEMLHSVPRAKFPPVRGLELLRSDKNILLHQDQLLKMAALPESFLGQLTYIYLNFGWNEAINPTTFTAFLSACTSVRDLYLEHGIYGLNQQSVLIEIPLLPNLKTFNWAGDYWVESVDYKCALPIVDVDESVLSSQTFVIDFGTNVYPRLKAIDLGLMVEMKFEALSQFPKLDSFYVPSSWNKFGFLRSTVTDRAPNLIHEIDIPPGIADPKSNCMPSIPDWFPNLTSLTINLPTVAGLRALVHNMADANLKRLYCIVNFQFEAALTSALLDIPYTLDLASDADRSRLEVLQEYGHWKSFVEYLKIELPNDDLDVDVHDESALELEPSSTSPAVAKGIGSLKCLQFLTIRQMPKKVFLPLNNRHWGNPEVSISQERWSANWLPFPERVLLQELTKLKGKLEYVNLPYFGVPFSVRHKFERAMGFDLDFTPDEYIGNVDSFTENVARSIGAAIKPEK